jgi:hypothetical protein
VSDIPQTAGPNAAHIPAGDKIFAITYFFKFPGLYCFLKLSGLAQTLITVFTLKTTIMVHRMVYESF